MTRIVIKKGDIFSVMLDNNTKKYFQYVADDRLQLKSNVIRAFKETYLNDAPPNLLEIVKGKVDFYAHCIIRWGYKRNLWQKEGNSKELGIVDVYFRGTNDYGHKLGEEPVKVSDKWFVWKINDERFTNIGKLSSKYENAEVGLVMNPYDIAERIKSGSYTLPYFPK